MKAVTELREALLHLVFPRVCAGCGREVPGREMILCLHCLHELPETQFEKFADNPVEKIFWGRLPLSAAAATYYFTKKSLMQRLMHLFKYRGARELGLQLGRLMGEKIRNGMRFAPDILVPLPLFKKKEKFRGYNQATVLCEGIAETLNIPLVQDAVIRPDFTETQTRKGRIERWKNIEGRFRVTRPDLLHGKHILLVDDVVTTGATLESCGNEFLEMDVELSIATLCYASS